MSHDQKREQGFLLVTSIVLLAILTVLGAVSFYKTNVEIKVSTGSTEAEQAFAAMNAGLNETYAYWRFNGSTSSGGIKELNDLAGFISTASGTAPSIYVDKYPSQLIGVDPYGFATSVADVYTQASTSGIRIYTLTANGGVSQAFSWGAVTDPQVAVWATSFRPQTTDGYPYVDPQHVSSTACSDCAVVVYALGKSGNALRLGREYMATTDINIKAFAAMINAPRFNNDTDCIAGTASTTSSTDSNELGEGLSAAPAGPVQGNSHLIDATQAPGGLAMASNNGINPPGQNKPWKTDHGTGTELLGIIPDVIYDPGKVASANYPATAGGSMHDIYGTVVKADLFAGETMNYFDSPSDQLFQLDAYREAANRISGFVTEDIYTYTVNTGGVPLGKYVALKTGNADHGRMGTLQWADVEYNIVNSIPMYGLVRLLLPTSATTDTDTICGNSVTKYTIDHDPFATGGKVSPAGKLIVYGGALIDFYDDANDDGVYDPATERLLTQQEALTFKINADNPLNFNPVMDGHTPRTGQTSLSPDYTQIDTYPNGAPSWDLTSDAMASGDGIMDMIWDVWNVGVNWSSNVYDPTGPAYVPATAPFSYKDWMTQESPARVTRTSTDTPVSSNNWTLADKTRMHTLLDYYVRTTAAASKNKWYTTGTVSLADIEGNYKDFYIDSAADLKPDAPSSADLYHAFLPSGYVHGWKRAMKETGLTAVGSVAGKSIWNTDLIGPGSPFEADKNKYFYVTGVGDAAKIDKHFADIPAEMYAGGLVDMHHAVNTSGVVYTPGQLELEQKNMGQDALQYINGVVITGHGVFMKNEAGADARTVIAYDDTSIDNLPTNKPTTTIGRKYWQELK